jgi:hypothetical protein
MALHGFEGCVTFLFFEACMIGSSQIGPRIREITKGRDQVEFQWLLEKVFGCPANEVIPIQRAIAESEMHDMSWIRLPRNNVWQRGIK